MGVIAEGNTLFVVDIEYTVPFEKVEPVIDAHMDFVRRGYDDGWFIMSGAKMPRTGGIVIAQGPTQEAVEAFLKLDPFWTEAVAEFKLTAFKATNLAEALK